VKACDHGRIAPGERFLTDGHPQRVLASEAPPGVPKTARTAAASFKHARLLRALSLERLARRALY